MRGSSNDFRLPVSEATLESSGRVMKELREKRNFQEHLLTNKAQPFIEKQPVYLSAYKRLLRSRNGSYLLECKGEEI